MVVWSTYRTTCQMPVALKSDFEVVRRNKVYEEVAKQIERLILKKLRPGDKLPSNGNWRKCCA